MKPLTVLYALFAIAAFVTAAHFGLPYWRSPGANLVEFLALAFANGPSSTLSVDLIVLYPMVCIWMVVEGRRLRMRHLWLYLVATLIAVAFAVGLFLLFRQRTLASQEKVRPSG